MRSVLVSLSSFPLVFSFRTFLSWGFVSFIQDVRTSSSSSDRQACCGGGSSKILKRNYSENLYKYLTFKHTKIKQ